MKSFIFALLFIMSLAVIVTGCKKEDNGTTIIQTPSHLPTYQPKGTISGKIIDFCTNAAVNGAVLSLGYNGTVYHATSDQSGSFSFADVPAGNFSETGGGIVITGIYTLTASLVNYNASQANPAKRYRNYYYLPVTITFTSLVPGDSLGVDGLVGSINFTISQLNTDVTGTVVDLNMQPVANAIVRLFDRTIIIGSMLQQTTTSASGVFKFSNVDNGISVGVTAVSSDGSLQTPATIIRAIPCNYPNDTLRAQVLVERVRITPADNVAPFVMLISPANMADVSPTSLNVVYTFSEPIRQTSYTRTDLGIGHGTIVDDISVNYNGLKKSAAKIPFTASWDATFTLLTITPAGIVGSAKYSVDMTVALPKLQDNAKNAVVNSPDGSLIGDFEVLNFTTNGSTPVPSAPNLTRLLDSARAVPLLPLDLAGGNVGLEWNYDANARSYNVYKSINGGSYTILNGAPIMYTQYVDASGGLFYGAMPDPFAPGVVKYKVTAVSKDLTESSASNVITVVDVVKPKLQTVTYVASAANNAYYVTLTYSEPMNLSSAENAGAYTFTNTTSALSIAQADYIGSSKVLLTARPFGALKPLGVSQPTLTVAPSVSDLQGNALDSAKAINVYRFPLYFFDSFEANWVSAGTTPAGWSRTLVTGSDNWAQITGSLNQQAPPTGNVAQDGNAVAWFDETAATAGNITRLESPSVDLSSSTAPRVTFYYVNTTGADFVRVRVSTDGGTNWATLSTVTTTGSSWTLVNVNLISVAGQPDVKVGLEVVADNGTSDIWIDNVLVFQ